MVKNLFVLTEKDLIKLSVMMLLAVVFFGLSGLMIMIFLQWITRQSYAVDAVDKHGISQISASRLGGAAVFVCSGGLLSAATYSGITPPDIGPLGIQMFGWIGTISCAALGLAEDLHNNFLTARFRLLAKATIFALLVAYWPFLIPLNLGVPGLDTLLALPLVGWFLTAIFCVGFINAVNMADGANGLMPGMLTIAFSLFYLETGGILYATLMTSCGLFAIFNVISGRLFLGDAGAYGLGAAVVISALYLFGDGVFSASFLAVLFSYPCIDLLVTLTRRLLNRRSIFLPDNDHLHNRIHFHFQGWFPSKTLANSLTGAFVVAGSSGVALAGYFGRWWPIESNEWLWVFVCQVLVYGVAFALTGIGRPISQHVVDAK